MNRRLNSKIRPIVAIIAGIMIMLGHSVSIAAPPPLVKVAEAFLNLHTGPGRGYPISHIAERGELVRILQQKTQWYQIRLSSGIEGWAHEDAVAKLVTPEGDAVEFDIVDKDDFSSRRWEFTLSYGDFDNTSSVGITSDWMFTENLGVEFRLWQVLGPFSDSLAATIGIQNQPFPDWRISPFFGIGTGIINTEPSSTVVQATDRTDQIVYAGAGTRIYITQRFFLRLEYSNIVILTSRENNEEIDEWKIGTAVFF